MSIFGNMKTRFDAHSLSQDLHDLCKEVVNPNDILDAEKIITQFFESTIPAETNEYTAPELVKYVEERCVFEGEYFNFMQVAYFSLAKVFTTRKGRPLSNKETIIIGEVAATEFDCYTH